MKISRKTITIMFILATLFALCFTMGALPVAMAQAPATQGLSYKADGVDATITTESGIDQQIAFKLIEIKSVDKSILAENQTVSHHWLVSLKKDGVTVQIEEDVTFKLLIEKDVLKREFSILHKQHDKIQHVEYVMEGEYAVFTLDHPSEIWIVYEQKDLLVPIIVVAAVVVIELIVFVVLMGKIKKAKSKKLRSVAPMLLAAFLPESTAMVLLIVAGVVAAILLVAIIVSAVKLGNMKKVKKPVTQKPQQAPEQPKPQPKPAPQSKPQQASEQPQQKVIVLPNQPAPEQPAQVEQPKQVEQPAPKENEKRGVVYIDGNEVLVRYNRSFVSKLMRTEEDTKEYYCQVANNILSYTKVKCKTSWTCSTFTLSRKKLAILNVKGKTLYLYVAIEPQEAQTLIKGKIKDMSAKKRYASVPTMLKVKSARGVKYAAKLVEHVMAQNGIAYNAPCTKESANLYPNDTTENLIAKKLIKVYALDGKQITGDVKLKVAGFNVMESVTAEQAHEMITDEVAATLVQTQGETTSQITAPGRKFAVNIDTLSQAYQSGEKVTIESLQEKGIVPKKETAIKILARGTLDKALIVHANAFSMDAVKMIVLTGGTAIKV